MTRGEDFPRPCRGVHPSLSKTGGLRHRLISGRPLGEKSLRQRPAGRLRAPGLAVLQPLQRLMDFVVPPLLKARQSSSYGSTASSSARAVYPIFFRNRNEQTTKSNTAIPKRIPNAGMYSKKVAPRRMIARINQMK